MTGRERFEGGDGVRGLAALSIVVWHALAFTLLYEPDLPVTARIGGDGRPLAETLPAAVADGLPQLRDAVWVFFALSGFLLARPFVHALLKGRPRPSLRRYARNRVLRIAPAFWAVVAVTVAIRGTGDDGPRELLALLTFSQLWIGGDVADELSHLWSLSAEAAFYVALPLLVLAAFALPHPRRAWPLAAAVLLLGALSLLAQAHVARAGGLGLPPGAPPVLLVTLGAAFVPGLLLAVVERRARGALAGRRTGPLAAALVAVAALAVLVDTGVPPSRPVVHQVLLTTVGGALLAAALVREWSGAPPWRPLVARATRRLGERSYSLFLVHLLVLDVLIEALDDLDPLAAAAVALTAGVPLTVLAAWALHAAVEAPFLRRRARPAAESPLPVGAAAPPAASSSASRR